MDFKNICKEYKVKDGAEKLFVIALNEKLHDTVKKKYHDRPKVLYMSKKDAEDLLGTNFTGMHKVGQDEDGNINYKFANGHQLGYYEACTPEQIADGHTVFSIKKAGVLVNEDIALLYEPKEAKEPKKVKESKEPKETNKIKEEE